MQGFNMGRYVPPDVEGRLSFNQASGKGHALGRRARADGSLTVRFECPFAVWCTNCVPEELIGQGVRFNAEKRRVGSYYSSPVWSFRFKHTVCGQWIEVRTDPKNTEYVVVQGGRRRDTGVDRPPDGAERPLTEEEKDRLESEGGFGALERAVEDRRAFVTQQERLDELVRASDRDWRDPFEMSKRLRRDFRVGRRKRQADERTGEALQQKFGLGVDLLPAADEDGRRARLVDFGAADEVSASTRPLFSGIKVEGEGKVDRGKRGRDGTTRTGSSTTTTKAQALQDQLRTNTRAVADPFLRQSPRGGDRAAALWKPAVRRKRARSADSKDTKAALVSYDSDST